MPVGDMTTIPCETCGAQTQNLGTQRCDLCWRVESQIDTYLRSDGGLRRMKALVRWHEKERREERRRRLRLRPSTHAVG